MICHYKVKMELWVDKLYIFALYYRVYNIIRNNRVCLAGYYLIIFLQNVI